MMKKADEHTDGPEIMIQLSPPCCYPYHLYDIDFLIIQGDLIKSWKQVVIGRFKKTEFFIQNASAVATMFYGVQA
jgi:hypothetical protein